MISLISRISPTKKSLSTLLSPSSSKKPSALLFLPHLPPLSLTLLKSCKFLQVIFGCFVCCASTSYKPRALEASGSKEVSDGGRVGGGERPIVLMDDRYAKDQFNFSMGSFHGAKHGK